MSKTPDPYNISPEPGPPDRFVVVRPISVAKLEYERRLKEKPSIPVGLQFTLGALLPYVYAVSVFFLIAAVEGSGMYIGELLIWPAIGVFLAAITVLRIKTGWTGLIPGLLTSILLLPVGGLVVCAAICATM